MRLNLDRVRANVREATTADLMNRATIYRDEMEPAALAIIDEELQRRGITAAQLADHEAEQRQRVLTGPDGQPRRCWKCPRPAVAERRGWYRLFGLIPLFPRRVPHCEEHRP